MTTTHRCGPAAALHACILSAALVTGVAVTDAAQAVVFSQLPVEVDGIGNISDLTSVSVGGTTISDQSADNFQVATGTSISRVRWWGAYGGGDLVPDDFQIRFFLDTGAPSPFPYPIFSVRPDSVSRVSAGFDNVSGLPVYEYNAALPAPYVINTNSTRHLSIVNETSTGGWIWHATDADFAFFRTAEGVPWTQTPFPSDAFELIEPVQIGPRFEVFVRDFLDVGPPLPPPVEIELFHPQASGGPSGLLSMVMQDAGNASGEAVSYDVENMDLAGSSSAVGVTYSATDINPPDETFVELLLTLASSNGSMIDLLSLRDFELVGPNFFSAWFEGVGEFGATTYHALFEATTGEFFDVGVGEPDEQSIPVRFGVRGDPGFSVTISASHVSLPAPASAALLLIGLVMCGLRRRGVCRPTR